MSEQQGFEKRNREIATRVRDTDETLASIGEDYGISHERVRQIAKKFDIVRADVTEGDRKLANGRAFRYHPEHPEASKAGWVPERIILAEEKVGRGLKEDELVIVDEEADHTALGMEDIEVRTREEHARISGLASRSWEDPEELLDALRWLALRLEHTPRTVDVSVYLPFSHATYYSAFGSMTAAQELAGLEPNRRGGGVEAADLPEGFREEYGHLAEYDEVQAVIRAAREAAD